MPGEKTIDVKVLRSGLATDDNGYFQHYVVASNEPLSVMMLLARAHETDPGLACRTSTCFKGKCGSCLVRVNGKDVFGCTTLVKPGETVVIEPHSGFRVIRDVVVDFSQPVPPGKKEEEGR